MGLSRAMVRAARRRVDSSCERRAVAAAVRGLNGGGAGGEGSSVLGEGGMEVEEGGSDEREGALSWSFAVNSRSWASMESESVVGRDSVFRSLDWKARRSCLRFAVMEAGGPLRRDFAWARRAVRVSFASGLGEDFSAWGVVDSSAEGGSSALVVESSAACCFSFSRNLRLVRRSFASFGAPVA